LRIETFTGAGVAPHLAAVAALRIAVFRDWPYLYDGDAAYESSYLETYARSPESLFVLAFDGARVVGASTGVPLAHEDASFQRAFVESGIDPATVFYFGESVLLHEYRGRGIGHRFFDEREGFARKLDRCAWTAFAAIDRDATDPRRPAQHRGNETFWAKRGYTRRPAMTMRLAWKEVGAGSESEHALTFWTRRLPG
jgi:GNAT superfamily N-acetyltransferase